MWQSFLNGILLVKGNLIEGLLAACSVFISLLSSKLVHRLVDEAKMFAHPIYHFIYSAQRTKMQPHLANINHTTC